MEIRNLDSVLAEYVLCNRWAECLHLIFALSVILKLRKPYYSAVEKFARVFKAVTYFQHSEHIKGQGRRSCCETSSIHAVQIQEIEILGKFCDEVQCLTSFLGFLRHVLHQIRRLLELFGGPLWTGFRGE